MDIFESIGSAAAAAGCGKVTMWRYMKDDKAYKGYHYRYPCKDTLPGAVWRVGTDIPLYEVSNVGRVRNRSTGMQMRGFVDSCSHKVRLAVGERVGKNFVVSRLVATEFVNVP